MSFIKKTRLENQPKKVAIIINFFITNIESADFTWLHHHKLKSLVSNIDFELNFNLLLDFLRIGIFFKKCIHSNL